VANRTSLPDLLILGDSHTAALKAGCDAHGLRAEVLGFSGNLWHAGLIFLNRAHDLRVRGPAMQARIKAVEDKLGGGSVLRPDLPVLASVGFHLGRLVPPFGFGNHTTEKEAFEAAEDRLYASSALVADYAQHFRGAHQRFLRRLSRLVPLTVVAPPHFYTAPNYAAFYGYLADAIRATGVRFCDPREAWGGAAAPLGAEFLSADGVHGNGAYGERIVGHMLGRGMIARRAA
jgi:hypothetical protein